MKYAGDLLRVQNNCLFCIKITENIFVDQIFLIDPIANLETIYVRIFILGKAFSRCDKIYSALSCVAAEATSLILTSKPDLLDF
jgi:hypothetical protein